MCKESKIEEFKEAQQSAVGRESNSHKRVLLEKDSNSERDIYGKGNFHEFENHEVANESFFKLRQFKIVSYEEFGSW